MATLESHLRALAARAANEADAVRAELAAAFAARPRGVSAFCNGKPAASEVVLGAVAPYAFTIAQANCSAKAQVAATGSTVFQLKKNGTNVCTLTFSAAGTVAAIGAVSSGSVAAGDVLTIVAPGTADATLADIAFLIRE